jgi:hypothetical protein
VSFAEYFCLVLCLTADGIRERPDTIRSIVANLVGDDDSGDSLVDENEPIQPLQNTEVEDYTDPNWDPEPIDAGPGKLHHPVCSGWNFQQLYKRVPNEQAK